MRLPGGEPGPLRTIMNRVAIAFGLIVIVAILAYAVTTLIVTPLRVLFLILLVGTTLEILAERSRTAFRIARWRRKLKDHIIVCGYGSKGR